MHTHRTNLPIKLDRFVKLFIGLTVLAVLTVLPFMFSSSAQAANPSGDLRIEIFTAYNLIVDSNVESPSTYAPEAFHIGAQFCNDGTNAMTDVLAYVGNYIDGVNDTPGTYPSRTHTGLTGTFSLTHLGGSAGPADAVRYIGSLPAGECRVQYWLVGYPRLDANGKSVTLGIKPDDDLWLQYDVWATAKDGGSPVTAETTRKVTMRNEISAMANKIWPNTSSKVPNEFLQLVNDLGWSSPEVETNQDIYPGQTFVMEGVWYDLGNINKGFDNNGDLLPDYNVWLQPVGDPNTYDAGCFRMVQTDAIVIIKLNDGTLDVRTATNQLYFENIPDNNRGGVGLVYYTFAATNGSCTSTLSPYQEVASGKDNEKFNGDYGTPLPAIETQQPSITMNKVVDKSIISGALPQNLTYTMAFTNTGPTAIGLPDLGMPLVVRDSVPAGTTYIAGSAAAGNTLPGGVTAYTILYSTNNGASWTTTEPAAASVTDIQWWLSHVLPAGNSGVVTFQVTVPTSYPNAIVPNTAGLGIGTAAPFVEDSAFSLKPGANTIGDTVWADDGAGIGTGGDGIKNGSEAGIANIGLTLYYDVNGDGKLDSGDTQLATTNSQVTSGAYSFNNLPDGKYLVAVNTIDGDLPNGYVPTTDTVIAVDLDSAQAIPGAYSYLEADFGFSPVLNLTKSLVSTSPLYEGDVVTYTIDVRNLLYAEPPALNSIYYATSGVAGTLFTAGVPGNVTGAPDGVAYSSSDASPNAAITEAEAAFGSGFTATGCGNITRVEAVFTLSFTGFDNDNIKFLVFNDTNTELFNSGAIDVKATLDTFGTPNDGDSSGYRQVRVDITSGTGLTNWSSWDNSPANEIHIGFGVEKDQSNDAFTLNFDAVGVEFTVDDASCFLADNSFHPDTSVNPLPLVDTYDPAKLQFVSASTPPNSTAPAGTLSWSNIGPLNVGLTKTITVTFRALEPLNNTAETITNTASVTGATMGSGLPTNDDSDSAAAELRPTGSIGDYVWRDINGDGSQAGESGIPNVVVQLTPPAGVDLGKGVGVPITTTTDSSGFYLFDGLRNSGNYVVTVLTASLPVGGGSFTNTHDEDGDKNNQTTVNLDHDATNGSDEHLTADFGYQLPTLIDGNIWHDFNRSGTAYPDSGEDWLANVSVQLTGPGCSPCTTTTDANGYFQFAGSYNGSYTVTVVPTTGAMSSGSWTQSFDTNGLGTPHAVSVSVTTGQTAHVDYSYYKTGTLSIGDTVYYDWNGDATQDPEDEGIPNITVILYEDTNNNGVIDPAVDAVVMTTTTSTTGFYQFTTLPAGNYIVDVVESDPDFPGQFNPTQDPNESGICTVCDGRGRVALTASTNLIDFGYDPTGSGRIGDTVFIDANGDGVQSGVGETGIMSVTVSLQVDFNGDGTYVTVATTQTDATGNYLFSNLPDGNYRVVVDTNDADLPVGPLGYTYIPTTLTTHEVTMSGGSVTSMNGSSCSGCDLKSDFGFVKLGSIGDMIFWDANNNGTQDWNEVGIGNVNVTLTNAATQTVVIDGTSYAPGAVISTTTTADGSGSSPAGFYRFPGLPPGSYTVTVDKTGVLNGISQTADPDRDGENCASTTYPSLPACDDAKTVTLGYGTNYLGADFGYQPSGVVGDLVFFDQDGDGIQDATELGIGNLVVTATMGATVITTTTDADGYYSFQGLTTGSWTISVQQPSGMAPTASSGTDLAVNGIGSVGATSTTVVVDGSGSVSAINGTSCTGCDLNVDFGFAYAGQYTVTGTICLEGGSNGGCEIGDTPLVTQTVFIYNSSNQLIGSTSTDVNGVYTFTNLIQDSYYVVVGTQTTQLSNTNLNTTVANSPANATGTNENQAPVTGITRTAASAYQLVQVNPTTSGPDNAVIEVDFSFTSAVNYDYGDLPNSYSTSLTGSPSGPRHIVPSIPNLYLGSPPDSETDGAPGAGANGDGADEDGVTVLYGWTNGTNGGRVEVDVTGSGWLVGWVDFNQDGDFYDSGEMVISQAVVTGTNQLIQFDVPAGTFDAATAKNFYTRFRLFQSKPAFPQTAFVGTATNGEVEDYVFGFSPTAVALKQVESGPLAAPVVLAAVLLGLLTMIALLGRRRFRHQAA